MGGVTCIPFETPTGAGVVCVADEVEITGVDLRTREGREAEVLAQIREYGGFSGFWATESLKRAYAIDRLTDGT